MRVIIHNGLRTAELPCTRSAAVASLKAAYIDSDAFVGDPGDVQLVFRGVELDDMRQLRDYGIEGGSVLAHVPAGGGKGQQPPRPPVDYAAVAQLLAQARRATLGGHTADPADYSTRPDHSDWGTEWTGGDAWLGYPLVMAAGGHPPLAREDVLQAGDDDEEDDGEDGDGAAYGRGFLASAGDAELEAAEAALEARFAAGGGSGGGASGGGESELGGGEAHSNGSVPRSPLSQRRVPTAANGRLPAGDGGARGSTTLGDSDVAAARERAALKAALRRVREARRARQAIVRRDTSAERVVPFGEGGAGVLPLPRPTRAFRTLYLAQVGRFAFRTLHRLEGRWVGDAEAHVTGRLSALPDVRVVTTTLNFDDLAGVWRERQSLTSRDGLVVAQGLTLAPIADGLCAVELDHHHGDAATAASGGGGHHHHPHSHHHGGGGGASSAGGATAQGGPHAHAHRDTYASAASERQEQAAQAGARRGYGGGASGAGGGGAGGGIEAALLRRRPHEMTLQELSDTVLVLTATSRSTGRPVLIETITLTSDMQRVRTVQRFDEGAGTLACLYMIRETRVLDAVSGAMMEPPRHAGTTTAGRYRDANGGGEAMLSPPRPRTTSAGSGHPAKGPVTTPKSAPVDGAAGAAAGRTG